MLAAGSGTAGGVGGARLAARFATKSSRQGCGNKGLVPTSGGPGWVHSREPALSFMVQKSSLGCSRIRKVYASW